MAACYVAFYGFLRAGELTVPVDNAYYPAIYLSYSDITVVDNPSNTQVIRITIKQSKTDPFRKGIDFYLGRMCTDVCSVISLINDLLTKSTTEGHYLDLKVDVALLDNI